MGIGLAASLIAGASAAHALTQDEANTIATEAYLYFYPLVTMELTRQQTTNMAAGVSDFGGPANWFTNVPTYPKAEDKAVVRPNFDTLYSSAWLDLAAEPLVISVPDTNGRYYLLPMLDMWTDVFASTGWRTTGTGEQTLLITPPGWQEAAHADALARLPQDTQRIAAPTLQIWIIGRIKTDGPDDYDAVHKIQSGLKVAPLSKYGTELSPPAVEVDASIDMKTPPKTQVDTMSGKAYFKLAAALMKTHPPHITDQPILARMKRLGIEVGKDFDADGADAMVQAAIEQAPAAGQKVMAYAVPRIARVANNWSMNTDTMGVYGTYYIKRATVAQAGLGANLVEDAIYPLNLGDSSGAPLDGTNNYVMHFDKDNMPPAGAFWSVTLYDEAGFQIANDLNRFAVSSWMPFVYNADGSLDLYVQNESPGADKEANWLPAPKGPFNLTMRLYAPMPAALNGQWNPPVVTKAE